MNEYNKRKQTHRYRKQASAYYWGEGRGGTTPGQGVKRFKLLGIT